MSHASHEFLQSLKDKDLFEALRIVIFNAPKEIRVKKAIQLLKQSSFRTYVVSIRHFDEIIENFSKDKKQLELEAAKITVTHPSDWHDRMFCKARTSILYDLIHDNPNCTYEAVKVTMHSYSHRQDPNTEKVFTTFLADLASVIWPESSIIGALYG